MLSTALNILSTISTSVMSRQRPREEDDVEEETEDVQVQSNSRRQRISPLSITSVSVSQPGIFNSDKLELLSILFVESRKGRSSTNALEMNATFSQHASKFDSYCRQAITGLFLKRFHRNPVEALSDLKTYVIRWEICDAIFFDRWRLWRPQNANFQTQRGKERRKLKVGPRPTNERRWLDLYAILRREAFSNWVLFFSYPSSRIFLNALGYYYGNLYRYQPARQFSVYYDLEWNRKWGTIPHESSIHSIFRDRIIDEVDSGALLGTLHLLMSYIVATSHISLLIGMTLVHPPSQDNPTGKIDVLATKAYNLPRLTYNIEDEPGAFPALQLMLPARFTHHNIWHSLIYSYEQAWNTTQKLYLDCCTRYPIAFRDCQWALSVRRWAQPKPNAVGVRQWMSAIELVQHLESLVMILTDICEENSTAEKDVQSQRLLDAANDAIVQWKQDFCSSHVHIFFAALRCLGNHDLLVNPFFSYTTKQRSTMEEFVHRFSWDTIGLYYMVRLRPHIFMLLTVPLHFTSRLVIFTHPTNATACRRM